MLKGPDTGEECHAHKIITQQQDQTTKTHGLTSHSTARMCLGEHKSDHFCLKPLTAFPRFLGKRPKPFSWSTRTSAHFSSLFLIYALPLPTLLPQGLCTGCPLHLDALLPTLPPPPSQKPTPKPQTRFHPTVRRSYSTLAMLSEDRTQSHH